MNDRIKELRKALDMTLEEFGRRLGVTKTAISKIEKGERNVTEQMFISICREYNVNGAWLREGIEPMFAVLDATDIAHNHFGYIMGNTTPQKKAVLSALIEMVYQFPDDKWDYVFKQFTNCLEEAKKEEADGN